MGGMGAGCCKIYPTESAANPYYSSCQIGAAAQNGGVDFVAGGRASKIWHN
jgi:hypothetical protein